MPKTPRADVRLTTTRERTRLALEHPETLTVTWRGSTVALTFTATGIDIEQTTARRLSEPKPAPAAAPPPAPEPDDDDDSDGYTERENWKEP